MLLKLSNLFRSSAISVLEVNVTWHLILQSILFKNLHQKTHPIHLFNQTMLIWKQSHLKWPFMSNKEIVPARTLYYGKQWVNGHCMPLLFLHYYYMALTFDLYNRIPRHFSTLKNDCCARMVELHKKIQYVLYGKDASLTAECCKRSRYSEHIYIIR